MRKSQTSSGIVYKREDEKITALQALSELLFLAERYDKRRAKTLSLIIRDDIELLHSIIEESRLTIKTNNMNSYDIHITEYIFKNGRAYKNLLYDLIKKRR